MNTSSIFGCDSKKLLECLNQKGGVTCFYKYSCDQDKYKKEYCQNFNLGICLQYDGGKACLSNLDECNYLKVNERDQDNNKIAISNSSNSVRTKNPSRIGTTGESASTKNKTETQNDQPTDQAIAKEEPSKNVICKESDVKLCLKNQGGETCFVKYGCESKNFKISFCQAFDVNKCLNFSGGNSCLKNQNFCKSILPQETLNQTSAIISQTPKKQNPVIAKNLNSKTQTLSSTNSDPTKENQTLENSTQETQNASNQNPNPAHDQSLVCNSQKVSECEQRGSGDDCYTQNHCTPLAYQADFCQNFSVEKCALNQGGNTCLQILKNCQTFLTKVLPKEQEKIQDQIEEQNDKSCRKESALLCLEKKGGATCFTENFCNKIYFQKAFCTKFKYSKCIDQDGSHACQNNYDACEDFRIAQDNVSDNLNRNNNFEGYLSILTDQNNPHHVQNIGRPVKVCDETLKASDENNRPNEQNTTTENSLLQEFEKFGKGVKTYRLGSYNKDVTDCSGFIMQAMKKLGFSVNGPQFDLNPNYPQHFKSCDPNNLKPGDVLLLNYPGRIPDHWILVSGKGSWPSGNIDMMDVSSDYVDGKPFYHGKLNRRSNLRAREVYSCVRHKDFSK